MTPQAAIAQQRHELYDIFFNADVHYSSSDEPPSYGQARDYQGPTPGFFDSDSGNVMMPQGMARAVVGPGYDEPDNVTWYDSVFPKVWTCPISQI